MNEFTANLELVESAPRNSLRSDDIHDRRTESEALADVKRVWGKNPVLAATFEGKPS